METDDANNPRVLRNPTLRTFLDSDSDDELIEPIESIEPIDLDLSESSASLEITEYWIVTIQLLRLTLPNNWFRDKLI